MRIIKYRPKYWLIVLEAVMMMHEGIGIGIALSSHQWMTVITGLCFGAVLCGIIVVCIAGSYVTTIGMPIDVARTRKPPLSGRKHEHSNTRCRA